MKFWYTLVIALVLSGVMGLTSPCGDPDDPCMDQESWKQCRNLEINGCKSTIQVLESFPLQFACGDNDNENPTRQEEHNTYSPFWSLLHTLERLRAKSPTLVLVSTFTTTVCAGADRRFALLAFPLGRPQEVHATMTRLCMVILWKISTVTSRWGIGTKQSLSVRIPATNHIGGGVVRSSISHSLPTAVLMV
jgi:hypothetical protein